MLKIAVDAMGGDAGPQSIIEGAVHAANDFDLEIVLVGKEDLIKTELAKHRVVGGRLTVHHAGEVIEMSDEPVKSVVKRKDSSIVVAMDLAKRGEVQAVVSAGNTGAMVAAATLILGVLPGIKRPGIATLFPTIHGLTAVIDVGANLNPTAEQLFQYALMVEVFVRKIVRKVRPTIALLNVGEEESKGTEAIKETYRILRDSELNFIGNIEGRDIFSGRADCVICDGYVGNVALKVAESLFTLIMSLIKKELKTSMLSQLGALMCRPALTAIKKETNYEEVGGAPLLGANGNVIIAHGASSAYAFRSAIRTAADFVRHDINSDIVRRVGSHKTSEETKKGKSL